MEEYLSSLIEKHRNRELSRVLSETDHDSRAKICRNLNLIECAVDSDNAQAMINLLRGAGGVIEKSNEDRKKLGQFLFFANTWCADKVIFQFLLSIGADPNIKDDEGHTPLGNAVEAGDFHAASLLLLCGANDTIDTTTGVDNGHDSALQRAVRRLDAPMVSLLLSYGADPNAIVDDCNARECLPEKQEHSKDWDIIESLLDGVS